MSLAKRLQEERDEREWPHADDCEEKGRDLTKTRCDCNAECDRCGAMYYNRIVETTDPKDYDPLCGSCWKQLEEKD